MSVNPYAPGTQPPGLPASMVQGLVERLISPPPAPGTQPAGPVAAAPPAAGPMPAAPPAGPPQAATPPKPGEDGPQPPSGPPKEEDGLSEDQAKEIQLLMADPKVRHQVQQLLKRASKEEQGDSKSQIDPARKLGLAQHWNARIGSLAAALNTSRSPNPGASAATDEALLRVWYMTPIAPWSPPDEPFPIPHDDIDEYADTVRTYLVTNGWTNVDKIEDQVTRECFPLREALLSAGRDWQQRVDFTDQMHDLTERWLKKHDELPEPDLKVLAATKAGKGDPESQARDSDSEAFPAGGLPTPPLGQPA